MPPNPIDGLNFCLPPKFLRPCIPVISPTALEAPRINGSVALATLNPRSAMFVPMSSPIWKGPICGASLSLNCCNIVITAGPFSKEESDKIL